ncbi:hypothetical protein BaRGS_00039432 [Batillaria attramentaria]|uniref:Uncharacterized protein n=1 Tax=Batillaria attramentaria TaxID=370345 RepID=A0ABD0J414_9CAEN
MGLLSPPSAHAWLLSEPGAQWRVTGCRIHPTGCPIYPAGSEPVDWTQLGVGLEPKHTQGISDVPHSRPGVKCEAEIVTDIVS